MMTLFEYDAAVVAQTNDSSLWGVDEAGRGPLAGPVYAAAVCIPPGILIEGINDSKKLSEKKREQFFKVIIQSCYWEVGTASAEEIDNINILNSTFLAMRRAVSKLQEKLKVQPGVLLIDGNQNPGICANTRLIVRGDGISAAIAAASIVAKVSRDRQMLLLHQQYPRYHFDKHKGYGTKLHYQMIGENGICPEHRVTFLKNQVAQTTEK